MRNISLYFCRLLFWGMQKIRELIMQKIFISFYLIILSFTLFSQEQGYKIKFELTGVETPMLYVKGSYGHQDYIFDSIKPQSKYVYLLQNKKRIIPDGMYELVDKEENSYMRFIVSQSRDFSIKKNDKNNYAVTGCDENKFFALIKSMEDRGTAEKMISQFIETSPESLLSKCLKINTRNLIAYCRDENGIIEFLLDFIDFNDARLLRTKTVIDGRWFFQEIEQHPDTINYYIDKLIAKTKNNDEVRRYYLQHLYKIFDTGLPEHASVLVHLYDNYCPNGTCDWLDDHFNRRIKREVLRKRQTLVGQTVPPLEAYTLTHEKINTKDIKNQYIILWFWDPDCEDCLEKTPKLYEFYQDFHHIYDFEVMAISITEDYDRWIKLIPQFPDWINVSFAIEEPNYDFVDYFDLITTPGIFMIDKNHKIIARQFSLEEIFTIFGTLKK